MVDSAEPDLDQTTLAWVNIESFVAFGLLVLYLGYSFHCLHSLGSMVRTGPKVLITLGWMAPRTPKTEKLHKTCSMMKKISGNSKQRAFRN